MTDSENELMHYGILRKSGRYPWGSGENPYQRSKSFQGMVAELRAQGLSPAEIAKGLGFRSTTELREATAISKNHIRAQDAAMAVKLREKGLSNVAIGERMGVGESQVRALLKASEDDRLNVLNTTADFLRSKLDEGGYIDVGTGVENYMGISKEKKNTAIALLEEEGYKRFYVPVEQLGTGKPTTVMILAPEGTTFGEVMKNQDKIHSVAGYSEDGGRTITKVKPPVPVKPERVAVRYAEEGGADKDGVIELRRGVQDLSLGSSRYAQVRIGVGKDHYLKGMAMYSDDMPDGVDILFNTNKSDTGNKFDAMKKISDDPDLPFGSIIRQKTYVDSKGKTKLSPLNIVGNDREDGTAISGEEGSWRTWSANLSSQMLSKQSPSLAERQLGLSFQQKQQEFDEIMSLTNPAIKEKLLLSFADSADSSAVHLKAAGLPRTSNHVILPINSLKDNEIYAPNYNNGEKVVLIRHPHGGKFEIPELTVNNRNKEANRLIKNAVDAVGINSKVAQRLSGADFDGDTVLVIPNAQSGPTRVKTSPALEGLKNFDPQKRYPYYEGMPIMKNKQRQMGDISNLITDMTIKFANDNEIARAVRHSMVVIDAEKHKLNYKQSYIDNGIAELKEKYQGGVNKGASTLVSKAKSPSIVDARRPRKAADGGPINPKTGEKMWEYTGETYTKTSVNKRTGAVTTKEVKKTQRSTKMAEVSDAHKLSSGTKIEEVYANHANRLKSLANQARKAAINVKPIPYSPSAKETYKNEVDSLNRKLNIALKNAPLERQAQVLANSQVSMKRKANPGMDSDQLKKVKNMALVEARIRTGAKKQQITFTPSEWDAIQAGAISNHKLKQILNNADTDQVKQLATPRTSTGLSSAMLARAEMMLARGYTQAEVASTLGVSTSTLNNALK